MPHGYVSSGRSWRSVQQSDVITESILQWFWMKFSRIIKSLIHETESQVPVNQTGRVIKTTTVLKFSLNLPTSWNYLLSPTGPSQALSVPSLREVEFETCGQSAFDCLVQKYHEIPRLSYQHSKFALRLYTLWSKLIQATGVKKRKHVGAKGLVDPGGVLCPPNPKPVACIMTLRIWSFRIVELLSKHLQNTYYTQQCMDWLQPTHLVKLGNWTNTTQIMNLYTDCSSKMWIFLMAHICPNNTSPV